MIAVCALSSSPWELNPFSYELPESAVSDEKLKLVATVATRICSPLLKVAVSDEN